MPYGYRNFLFSWIDTENKSYPPILDIDLIILVFRLLENITSEADRLLTEALNWRLGTKGLKLWEIEVEALKQNRTIRDLMAQVEPEGIKYSDGYSYVCSCYVASFWKRAGVLPGIKFWATEMTPRDIYLIDIFDKEQKREYDPECRKQNPDQPYCQFMGEWKMELYKDNYSSIKPYNKMFETCPSQPPLYELTPGC